VVRDDLIHAPVSFAETNAGLELEETEARRNAAAARRNDAFMIAALLVLSIQVGYYLVGSSVLVFV